MKKVGHDLNPVIARLLYGGLLMAVFLLLIGTALAAARVGPPVPRLTSIGDIPRALRHFEAGGFFSLGLLILLITPAARVAALLVAFTRDREWLFASISLVVLALLALSGILGLAGL
ncbi:MAG: DUF1634 domain-containing protein [Actinobacteria bacterium]|nr:DUF1634 domain-containing protein [Actinomycetota bacterium]